MILTGKEILKCVNNGTIVISPFDQKNLQANSYDFHIDNILKVYKNDVLDAQNVNETEEIIIPENGILLDPNQIYLGKTQEVIGSNNYVPIIKGRSSTGRLGIFVNITADLIDLGSIKQCTLMLNSVLPVKIYPNMPIGQVTFWSVEGEI
ncbi:MAG TPA: dCTP deaminase [Candidatus Dojkabacteria bacterium]|jgi:dCTP deaminase|nr:dCTP deaminase [Candidatus Dojkabacteria bacterium]